MYVEISKIDTLYEKILFLDVPKCSAKLEVSISRCHSVVCVAVPKLSLRLLYRGVDWLQPQLLPSCPPPPPLISPPISDPAAQGHLPP